MLLSAGVVIYGLESKRQRERDGENGGTREKPMLDFNLIFVVAVVVYFVCSLRAIN